MTKYAYRPAGYGPGIAAQFFTDAGCTVPATDLSPLGDSGQVRTKGIFRADVGTGLMPSFTSSSATLYMKQLTYQEIPTGSATTLTGLDQTLQPWTAGLGSSTAVVASVAATKARPVSAPTSGAYQVFQGLSNGTDTGVNTMVKHVEPTGGTGLEVFSLRYANSGSTGSGEVAGANAVTIGVSVGRSTTGPWFPVTCAGALAMPIAADAEIQTDPISMSVPPGGTWYEKVYLVPAASGTWEATGTMGPIGTTYWCSHSNGETDLHASTAAFTAATGTKPFASNAVVSHTLPGNELALAVAGDSIAGGQGDGVLANAGFVYYALNGLAHWTRVAVSGSKRQNFIDPSLGRRRNSVIRGCNVFLDHYDTNDITTGRTLAQIQADMLTLWFSAARRGMKVFANTLGPVTTSSDNWITTANQTLESHNTVRVNRNNWLRDGAPIDATTLAAVGVGTTTNVLRSPFSQGVASTAVGASTAHPLYDYFEVADTIESARDSGKWAPGPRARQLTDFVTTTSSAIVTSATANFSSSAYPAGDVGAGIWINGAVSGAVNYLKVASVQSATQCTVNNGALIIGTVSGATGQVDAFGPTPEGTHPQEPYHRKMAAAISIARLAASVA